MDAKAHRRWRIAAATAGVALLVAASSAGAHELPMAGLAPMGAHMRLTKKRLVRPGDLDRARYVADALRRSIERYHDYRAALACGLRIFLPSVPQNVYHFVDLRASAEEYQGHFDPTRPGSLLYVKDGVGYRLVGAMYSAPPDYTPDDLDRLIPLSVTRWHVHTNICLPRGITLDGLVMDRIGAGEAGVPGMLPVANPRARELNRNLGFMADGRFGFEGRIAEPRRCAAAGGHFLEQAWGWMVHVYPFAGNDLKTVFGLAVPKASEAALASPEVAH